MADFRRARHEKGLSGSGRQLTAKLSRIPLGSVPDDHSGTYKNIIVERVDAMETTMAHMIRLSTEFGGQDRRTDSVSCSRVFLCPYTIPPPSAL